MKKSIAILLATAGLAMASSSGMMDITMDSHAYSMEELGLTNIGSKNVTVAMQLDWNTLSGLSSGEYIFKVAGDAAANRETQGGTLGMGVAFVNNLLYIGTTTGPNSSFTGSNSLRVAPDLTQDVTLAVLVYTARDHTSANKTDADFYLYLWGEGSDTPLTLTTNTVGSDASYVKGTNYYSYITNYQGINISANLVDKAEVYDEFIDATKADEIALEIYKNAGIGSGTGTDTTVPEPATATLSLLALAGLAARRRRK